MINHCLLFYSVTIIDLITGLFTSHSQGFRNVDLSNNPLSDQGVAELCLAVEKSETILSLRLAYCSMSDAAMLRLQNALVLNGSILNLDISNNGVSESVEIRTNVSMQTDRH